MRLPNGYGTVYKLSGKRRRPFIARKTVGWDENGKQICETIGFYTSKQEALQALADFNTNPYDLSISKKTFNDIYEMWSNEAYVGMNPSTMRNYITPYKSCANLYDMKMCDIRLCHLQNVIDTCGKNTQSLKRIKILFNRLYEYCMEHEYVRKNYAEYVKLPKVDKTPTERTAFTDKEISLLWDNIGNNEYISLVLMLIYSGVRIMELLDLKKEDVNLDEQYFSVREAKTVAGVRIVPIADKVLPLWKSFINKSQCPYAVCTVKGQRLTYDNFKRKYWKPLMSEFNFEHTPHETRHTCVSLLVKRNVNQTIIKKIVGHKSIMNLTERVYTHIDIKEFLDAINKI